MNNAGFRLDVNDIVDRLREAVGVRTDIALSMHLGRSKNVASGWRARQSVPYAECAQVARDRGLSLDWLVFGIGSGPADAAGVKEPGSRYTSDSRVARMVGFIQDWQATHDNDDVIWLERTLARTVPEYGEWLLAREN